MTVAFIYIGVVVSVILLLFAVVKSEYILGMFAAIGLMCCGVYIAIYNVEQLSNILTQTIAIVCIAIGAYVFIKGSLEQITEAI